MDSGNIKHRGWVVIWKSSELATITSAGDASSGATSNSRPPTNTNTQVESTNDESGGNDATLGGGAIVGIVVGIPAALAPALAPGVAVGLLLQRRGKKNQELRKGTPIVQFYDETADSHSHGTYELGSEPRRHDLV
ncbi:hypothetical protein B0T10DRAFT_455259 [Thelonectria olida]|uniref:Uncharacterized protein n=1 Tax=Thelonectria olida TaxID=1576542 RepID=A0A9P9AUJ0_9HYPO|nr:hypothetical protein B0T10DRAFT_455259 [Thelonectria olida]